MLSLEGLVAATFTPLDERGELRCESIPALVDFLVAQRIAGLYVLGSTGEGVSLAEDERRTAAASFVAAAAERLPVIVQVGSESLVQSRRLAAHAQDIGAAAISAVSPVYFKPDSLETLVASMAEIARGAPQLPFYYYHIPAATGVAANMVEFLRLGEERIATLRGIKFTSPSVFEFQSCLDYAAGRFDILWGTDEMLLSGLTAGARAAVGSTYNFAAPIYHRLMAALAAGDLDEARRQQSRSQALVRAFIPFGPRAAQKAIMNMIGYDCGPTRLPVAKLETEAELTLRDRLATIGFFDWISEKHS